MRQNEQGKHPRATEAIARIDPTECDERIPRFTSLVLFSANLTCGKLRISMMFQMTAILRPSWVDSWAWRDFNHVT